ncbi:MAG: hypothetical protein Q8R67_09345 [Rhodoferax sp.]|nr:hypothetical protein [Rhodoferax sp.]MDP3651873.1 hypothetical protein [Rhodoferax sp.]
MPDIEAKLRFLRSPHAYGQSSTAVDCIETHMSWLFLVGTRVFKLKKAVCFPFLDFTTLKAREFYCQEEVRLNVRLAPGVYLGVVALQWHDGAFTLVPGAQLPAPGETQDWLVLMRRLPLHQTLLHRIHNHHVNDGDLEALVRLLGAFYKGAPPMALDGASYVSQFQHPQPTNRGVLLHPPFQLPDAAQAMDRFDAALAQGADLLRARASHQRIVDGHGDLRPDHIFLRHPPVVIDCLEFNAALRQVDPFDELAYLGLECDMAGAPWIGPRLIQGLARALRDQPPPALVHLYTAHRALLRARLAVAHLLDPHPRTPETWLPLAERYLQRALAATEAFTSSMRHGWP